MQSQAQQVALAVISYFAGVVVYVSCIAEKLVDDLSPAGTRRSILQGTNQYGG